VRLGGKSRYENHSRNQPTRPLQLAPRVSRTLSCLAAPYGIYLVFK
jgi:hypothetical protein